MAFFRKQSNAEKQIEQLKSILASSFHNVKRDSQTILEWINFLHRKNQRQEQVIASLARQLDYMPKTRQEIKQIIDYYYSHDHILKKIQDLNERVDSLFHLKNIPFELEQIRAQISNLPKTQAMPHNIDHIEERLAHIHGRLEKVEAKKHSFKEKLVQKIAKRSKDYVKSVMLSYIRKYGRISGLQLKEMVVDEQALCSKSSFYRLLNEIESLEEVSVIQKGKEKHYLSKITKKH